MNTEQITCSYCQAKPCVQGDVENFPKFCPSRTQTDQIEEAKIKLRDSENRNMVQDVCRQWKELGKLTRVEETMLYAKLRGYKKLGIAFCIGLADEAQLLTNVLLNEGFDVASVCCMCGGFSSDDVALPEVDKIVPGRRQPICNPIGQALVLDAAECELNIVLGLCVGDDTLFIKHTTSPVTVLAVKDRVLAHNPLGVLHTSRNIGSRLNTSRPVKQQ